MTQQLILKSYQSPGDIVMLSAAVRDLHRAYPAQFVTDVRTSAPAVWEHNPYLTPLGEGVAGVRELDMHYPAIHQSNQRPYHFIHGFTQYLEQKLELRIPVTRFAGDIHLSEEEKQTPPLRELGVPDRYWIVVAGGKYDFTAKWWAPARFQAVVDHFAGQIRFVQCGEAGHWHPPLERVANLVGRTSLRQLIQLVHHADGVLCSVTLAMHLAAAVEPKLSGSGPRPCVVVAGGREPAHWEAYPNHQFLSTNGALDCCRKGGCWKSRCQRVGDGDAKDSQNACEKPVQVDDHLRIPRCMDLITAQDVIRRIELFCQEETAASPATVPIEGRSVRRTATAVRRQRKISVGFFHGLGDCVYFAHLIPLYQSRGYEVEVRCEENKRFLFEAAGAIVRQDGNLPPHPWDYPPGHTHEGQGRFWQGSKMGHNISRAPLPNIGSTSDLWQEYCQVRIPLESQLPAAALRTAEQWLSRLPRPVVLLHTKGNSGQARKSLPDDVTAQFYRAFIEQCEGTLLLLDWDHRVPRLASYRVRHLDEFGECPLECLLALLSRADLLIGIDSGPLHVARFTSIPTIGLWMPGHYPATYTLPRETQLNVVLADHTPWQDGAWIGKGAKAVPYLLTQGWQVLYAGYQVILTRNDIR